MIHLELVNIKKYIEKSIVRDKTWSDSFESLASMFDGCEPEATPSVLMRSLCVTIEKASKTWVPLTDAINRIGQMQILRCSISHEVNTSCRFQSRHLAATLDTFNQALLNEIENKSLTLKDDSPLLFELSNYLEWTGFTDPLSKVYINNSNQAPHLDIITLTMVVTQINRFVYQKTIHGLTAKRPTDACDGMPFIYGCVTFLKQFHVNVTRDFLHKSSCYINHLSLVSPSHQEPIPVEAANFLFFLEEFLHTAKISSGFLTTLPPALLDHFKTLLIK